MDKIIELGVWRNGEQLSLQMVPEMTDYQNSTGEFEKRILIGVGGYYYFGPAAETPSLFLAVELGAGRVYNVLTASFNGLKQMVLGNVSVENLQGPIGIARVSGIAAKISLVSFVGMIAMISTAIGMLNLFPIPVLDGGHLATYVYEALRGKPPNPRFMQSVMAVGIVLLLSMMLLATYNDIMRI
jgi:regulator of sigma E protease